MAKVEGRLGTGAVWKKLKWIAVSPALTFRAQTVPSACFRTGTQGIRQVCDAEQSLHRRLSGYIQGLQLTGLRRSRHELARRIPAVRPDQGRPSLLKLDGYLDRRVMAESGSVSLTVDVRSSPNFYISDQYAKMVLYRWIIERPSTGEDGSPFIYPSEMIDYLGELVSRIASLIQSARVFSGPHCAHLRGCIEERTAALILLCLGVTAAVGV